MYIYCVLTYNMNIEQYEHSSRKMYLFLTAKVVGIFGINVFFSGSLYGFMFLKGRYLLF